MIIKEGPYKGWPSFEYVQSKIHPEMDDAKTVKELTETSAKLWPSKFYLMFAPSNERFTFQGVNEEANKIAYGLLELGVKKGDRIAIYLRNSPTYLLYIYACAKIGVVEVPVNWFYREEEAKHVIGNSEATAVIVESDLAKIVGKIRGALPALRNVIVVGDAVIPDSVTHHEITKGKATANPAAHVGEEDLIAIIYTSGTTGLPKGTMLTHRSYVLSAKAASLLGFSGQDNNYTGLPLFHINAQIYSSLGMMVNGARLTLTDRFSPTKFWEEIIMYDATCFNLLGAMINILYAQPESPLDRKHTARRLIIGGTPRDIWTKFEERFGIEIQEGYSQTEDPLPFANPPGEYRKVGSFGVPLFPELGHDVLVVDEDGRPLPPDTRGELIRRSPATMAGYWGDAERTRETVRDGWLYSGDIVVVDQDGYAFFVDRKKFVVRRSGETIATWEVESVIKVHPKVEDVVVIPVPDRFRGEEAKAFIRPKRVAEPHPEEIIEWTAKKLAYFKVPRYIEITEVLPYTPTGRVEKWKLKERESALTDHGWDRDKMMPDWRQKFYESA